jgi:chaperonin GroES
MSLENGMILPLMVLVKEPPKVEKKTTTGLIIPETAKNPTITGEVVIVGDGTKNLEMTVRKGDKVLFGPNSFVKLTIEDEEYLLLPQQAVLFIWR